MIKNDWIEDYAEDLREALSHLRAGAVTKADKMFTRALRDLDVDAPNLPCGDGRLLIPACRICGRESVAFSDSFTCHKCQEVLKR